MIVEVENFLPTKFVDELVELSKNSNNWSTVQDQDSLPRHGIFNPIEELLYWFNDHPLFEKYKFTGYTLWKDSPDFKMDWHIDNNRVKIAVQIYLDDRNSPGTQFTNRTVKYGKNRGYIMFNNQDMKHCVPDQTPHEGRLSVYALYEPVDEIA